jgi:hypothetical protein
MFYDVERPEITLSEEWKRFCEEFSPHLVKDLIDRDKVCLPDWFVPLARGVVIAGNELLREAGHRPEMHVQLFGEILLRCIKMLHPKLFGDVSHHALPH